MKKLIFFLSVITLVSCGSSNQNAQVKEDPEIKEIEFLSKDVYTPQTVAISVFTPTPIDPKKAGAIFRKYDEPGKTITVFFYDDKTNVTDDNYYAHTNGKFLYIKDEPQGIAIE